MIAEAATVLAGVPVLEWDAEALAIHAARAHARALDELRALSVEPVKVKTRLAVGRVRSLSGCVDVERFARRDAILDAAEREGADRLAIVMEWQNG